MRIKKTIAVGSGILFGFIFLAAGVPALWAADDQPAVTSFDITPTTLLPNRINFFKLIVGFKDEGLNLYGGVIGINFLYTYATGTDAQPPQAMAVPPRLIVSHPENGWTELSRDSSRPTYVTLSLVLNKFKNAEGSFEVPFGLLGDKLASVTVFCWLRDRSGIHSLESPYLTAYFSTTPPEPKQGRKISDTAYTFTLLDAKGKIVSPANFKGKVVLLDFSTIWCSYCKEEAGDLQALYEKYRKQGLRVISILPESSAQGPPSPADLTRWVNTYHLTTPVVADNFWGVYDAYTGFLDLKSIPFNVLIDRNGKIRWKKIGYTPKIKAALEAQIKKLLAE